MKLVHNFLPGALSTVVNAYFFAAAGFFLAGHVHEKGWWAREIEKRFWSLVVPYFALNAVLFALLAVYQWPDVRFPVDKPGCFGIDLLRALGVWGAENPVDGPLWFVRSLVLYVIAMPLFMPFIRNRYCAAASCGCLFLMNCIDAWQPHLPETAYWIFRPQWLAFFLGGAAVRMHGVPRFAVKHGWVLLAAGCILACYAHPNKAEGEVIAFYNAVRWIGRPVLIAGLLGAMPAARWPKALTGNSFGIYALHWPFTMSAYIVGGHLGIFETCFGNVAINVLFMVLVIVATIGLSELLKRLPVLDSLLLGGRR